MLCEHCKQREANIRYTEVINGVATEHNLCSQCAKEMDFGPYSAIFEEFPLGRLLSGILGFTNESDTEDGEEAKEGFEVICPTCKTTYSQFVKDSRFGCPDCYGVFDLFIGENMKHLHGAERHTGKHPRYQSEPGGREAPREAQGADSARKDKETLSILNSRLKEAIREEQYEDAARYRDEIRVLKERMGEDA